MFLRKYIILFSLATLLLGIAASPKFLSTADNSAADYLKNAGSPQVSANSGAQMGKQLLQKQPVAMLPEHSLPSAQKQDELLLPSPFSRLSEENSAARDNTVAADELTELDQTAAEALDTSTQSTPDLIQFISRGEAIYDEAQTDAVLNELLYSRKYELSLEQLADITSATPMASERNRQRFKNEAENLFSDRLVREARAASNEKTIVSEEIPEEILQQLKARDTISGLLEFDRKPVEP